jgi:hypothetical protein
VPCQIILKKLDFMPRASALKEQFGGARSSERHLEPYNIKYLDSRSCHFQLHLDFRPAQPSYWRVFVQRLLHFNEIILDILLGGVAEWHKSATINIFVFRPLLSWEVALYAEFINYKSEYMMSADRIDC